MVFNHRVEQTRAQLPDSARHGSDVDTRDWIPLLRHRARRATVRLQWLADLAHLRLHHQLDVERKLGTAARQQRKEAARFRDPVTLRVPGNVGDREMKLFGELFLASKTEAGTVGFRGGVGVWDRSESAGSAAELEDEKAGSQLGKASLVAVECG